jgi:hypothetical protein
LLLPGRVLNLLAAAADQAEDGRGEKGQEQPPSRSVSRDQRVVRPGRRQVEGADVGGGLFQVGAQPVTVEYGGAQQRDQK